MIRILAVLTSLFLFGCSSMEKPEAQEEDYVPVSNKEIIYREFRFIVIDLFDVEQLSRKYVLTYSGTFQDHHLLVALPSDKFSFNETKHFALHASECEIDKSYYPEQSLFYNFTEVRNWKAIKASNGICIVKEDTQLRFLF